MQVEVRLSGFLRRMGLAGGFKGGTIDVPEGATVAAALVQIDAGSRSPWLVTHNGEMAKPDAVLQDGDVLLIIPPISGGSHGK